MVEVVVLVLVPALLVATRSLVLRLPAVRRPIRHIPLLALRARRVAARLILQEDMVEMVLSRREQA